MPKAARGNTTFDESRVMKVSADFADILTASLLADDLAEREDDQGTLGAAIIRMDILSKSPQDNRDALGIFNAVVGTIIFIATLDLSGSGPAQKSMRKAVLTTYWALAEALVEIKPYVAAALASEHHCAQP